MDVIPCKDCIVFAMCNSKVQKLNGVYKTQFIVRKLDSCSLFSEWLYRHGDSYSYQIKTSHIKHFSKFFKIKFDIEPDYHLAPTTYLGDNYENPR